MNEKDSVTHKVESKQYTSILNCAEKEEKGGEIEELFNDREEEEKVNGREEGKGWGEEKE